jgi:hypothetical protein
LNLVCNTHSNHIQDLFFLFTNVQWWCVCTLIVSFLTARVDDAFGLMLELRALAIGETFFIALLGALGDVRSVFHWSDAVHLVAQTLIWLMSVVRVPPKPSRSSSLHPRQC